MKVFGGFKVKLCNGANALYGCTLAPSPAVGAAVHTTLPMILETGVLKSLDKNQYANKL